MRSAFRRIMVATDPQAVFASCAAGAGSPLPCPQALLLFAHADDEVIAVGARMERFRDSLFLCVTDGVVPGSEAAAANGGEQAYRGLRRAEREAAFRHAGLHPRRALPPSLEELDGSITDQQAPFHLLRLARGLAAAIEQFRPEALITHPYEGGHPDHDSCAFAAYAATRLVRGGAPPIVVEAPFYHYRRGAWVWGEFLDAPSAPVLHRPLRAEEQATKRARLACFPTQAAVLAHVSTEVERYRLAPAYDFSLPPHGEARDYRHVGCALTSSEFCGLATEALRGLGLA